MPSHGKVYRVHVDLTTRQYHATLTWFTRAMKAMPRTDPATIAGVQKLHNGLINAYWKGIGIHAPAATPSTEAP